MGDERRLESREQWCFNFAAIKHQDQGSLQKKDFKWACGSRGLESVLAESKLGNQQLKTHTLNCKQKAGNTLHRSF